MADEEREEAGQPEGPERLSTEGDRAWRERTQETGEQARRLQPPPPEHPESAPTPKP